MLSRANCSLDVAASLVLGVWDLMLPLTDENHPLRTLPPLGCSTCPDSRATNCSLELTNNKLPGHVNRADNFLEKMITLANGLTDGTLKLEQDWDALRAIRASKNSSRR